MRKHLLHHIFYVENYPKLSSIFSSGSIGICDSYLWTLNGLSSEDIHIQTDLVHAIQCVLSLNVQYRFEIGSGKFPVLMEGL